MRLSRPLRGLAVLAFFGLWLAVSSKMERARIATPLPVASAASVDAPVVDSARLFDDVRLLSSTEYGGRKTGSDGNRKAQAFLAARFAALGLKPFAGSYAQPFSFTHKSIKGLLTPGTPYETAYPAAVNMVGYVAGSAQPDVYLVISAHYDHLGIKDGKLYPGADDNASGVAAMLAIAQWFKDHPPLHSVVFAAFDGEELGLQGAKAFVARLPFPRAQLALNLNLDMVSHNDQNEIFVAGTSYTPSLKPLVEAAAARSTVHVKLGHDRPPLVAGSVEDWTGSSDHGPFHDAGVPFLYFGVEDHPDYHAPSDTFERINRPFFARVASLLADTADLLDKHLDSVKN